MANHSVKLENRLPYELLSNLQKSFSLMRANDSPTEFIYIENLKNILIFVRSKDFYRLKEKDPTGFRKGLGLLAKILEYGEEMNLGDQTSGVIKSLGSFGRRDMDGYLKNLLKNYC